MRPKVALLYALLCVIWGTTWIALKVTLDGIPPILSVALRFAISSLLLWAIVIFRRERIAWCRDTAALFVTFGVVNFAFCYGLTTWGVQFIHSGVGAIIWSTHPILIALGAHLILSDDRLTVRKVLGGAFGLAGTAVIFLPNGSGNGRELAGGVAVFLAVAAGAWPTLLYKKRQSAIPWLQMNAIAQTISLAVLFPATILLERDAAPVWSVANVSALAYLAVVGTVVAWSIYFWLFSQLRVTQISAVALVPPVIALLLGRLMLGESLSLAALTGSALVLFGVYLVNTGQSS